MERFCHAWTLIVYSSQTPVDITWKNLTLGTIESKEFYRHELPSNLHNITKCGCKSLTVNVYFRWGKFFKPYQALWSWFFLSDCLIVPNSNKRYQIYSSEMLYFKRGLTIGLQNFPLIALLPMNFLRVKQGVYSWIFFISWLSMGEGGGVHQSGYGCCPLQTTTSPVPLSFSINIYLLKQHDIYICHLTFF